MNKYLYLPAVMLLFACTQNKKEEQTTTSAGTVITTDSLKISHEVYGNGDTTLLFLHGWGINKSYWDNQVNFFSPRYKVVTVDQAGFGFSDTSRTEYTIEQY